MRWSRLIVLIAMSPLFGCTMVERAVDNIRFEKALRADLEARSALHRQLATEAWVDAWAASGDEVPDAEFGEGFVDGFADYLDHGGCGEAPPVPPQKYWLAEGRSASGKIAATRHLEGFAKGAAAAKVSGLRQESTVVVVPPMPVPLGPTPPGPTPPRSQLPPPLPVPGPPVLPKPPNVPLPPEEVPPKKSEARRRPDVVVPWPDDSVRVRFSPAFR